MNELLNLPLRRKLKAEAVPSIFPDPDDPNLDATKPGMNITKHCYWYTNEYEVPTYLLV